MTTGKLGDQRRLLDGLPCAVRPAGQTPQQRLIDRTLPHVYPDLVLAEALVWLAGGATFAAFPEWYATLFSGFYLALFLILVALITMLAFGAVMAFALIFNTISVNVAEREGEYATMRANGLSQRKLASLITGENLLLTALGIIPGLIVGYAAATLFMQSYSSDMFAFNLDMNTSTLVFSSLAMLAVALLSVLPAIRTVRRLDIAKVVRERSA